MKFVHSFNAAILAMGALLRVAIYFVRDISCIVGGWMEVEPTIHNAKAHALIALLFKPADSLCHSKLEHAAPPPMICRIRS